MSSKNDLRMKKHARILKDCLDFTALAVGIFSLYCILFRPLPEKTVDRFCIVSGILGAGYIIYALVLYLFRRIEFDKKLLHGHFLRKVVCLVVLIPFTLALAVSPLISSPEELASEGNWSGGGDKLMEGKNAEPNLFWTIYFLFVDPGNQNMSPTVTGRGIAGVAGILGIFLLNGLLVSSIIGFTDRRKECMENGQARYQVRFLRKRRFAVIIGANEIAASVIRDLLSPGRPDGPAGTIGNRNGYVILQTNRDVQAVRDAIESHLSDEELGRVIIYRASRDSRAELEKLHLKFASEIYVLGESTSRDGGETGHDALNMKCVNLIAEILEGCGKKVCRVLFEYQTTYSIFQFSDFPEKVTRNLIFFPFNRYESWARKVIVDCCARPDPSEEAVIDYIPLDGHGIDENSDRFVHFVIIGMSKMGIAMGLEALQQAHYLNFRKRRTRITFIDSEADREMAFFKGRYENLFELARHRFMDAERAGTFPEPEMTDPIAVPGSKWRHLSDDGENFIDTEMEFIKGDVESEAIRSYLKRISSDPDSILTVAVCLPQTHTAVAASLYLPIEVYDKAQQIWVYQSDSADIISNLNGTPQKDKRYKMLRPFGMDFGEYLSDRSLYLKALLVNNVYDLNAGNPDLSDIRTVEEMSESWMKLLIDKKFASQFCAESFYSKIRGILPSPEIYITGYDRLCALTGSEDAERILREKFAAHRLVLAQCEHNRWNMQQLLFGYLPCSAEDDSKFSRLNAELVRARASGNPDEIKVAKYAFWLTKREFKESEKRIHPNICSFGHLDSVDSEAKEYDAFINDSIPRILSLTDRIYGN